MYTQLCHGALIFKPSCTVISLQNNIYDTSGKLIYCKKPWVGNRVKLSAKYDFSNLPDVHTEICSFSTMGTQPNWAEKQSKHTNCLIGLDRIQKFSIFSCCVASFPRRVFLTEALVWLPETQRWCLLTRRCHSQKTRVNCDRRT